MEPIIYESGDKVFVIPRKRLATVLDVYGDGVNGDCGDIRLDLSGNTPIKDIEKYDAIKHAAYNDTFTPIKALWKQEYGIEKDIQTRD